jgi:cytoskeletal protein RodZ
MRQPSGCYLRIEIGTTEIGQTPLGPAAERNKKHGWLPVLVVLFLISYALMTMLIIEQGRTIDSQRVLIHELFHDSQELSAVKQKAQEEQAAQSQAAVAQDPSSQDSSIQAPSTQTPLAQTPSNQVPSAPSRVAPSTHAPVKQAPSTQANPQNHARTETTKQKPFRMPSKPASDLVDAERSLNLI